jgi:ABC-type sugar transport system ATPase subunit
VLWSSGKPRSIASARAPHLSQSHRPRRGSCRQPLTIAGIAAAPAHTDWQVYGSPTQADLALVDDLAVYQNVFLDRELTWGFGPVRLLARRAMEERTQALFGELNVSVPSVSGKVRGLSGGQRQAVAIARGVMWGRELVIMDEPTAALGVRETAKVETLIRDLVTRGIGIIVISHNLEQVMRLSTRIWVMRRGQVVSGIPTNQASKEDVVAMITGLHESAPRRSRAISADEAGEPPERTAR